MGIKTVSTVSVAVMFLQQYMCGKTDDLHRLCRSVPSQVCVLYNRSCGPYGKCPEKEQCTRLHVCESFVRGRCDVTDCSRSHDFCEPHTLWILRRRGVSDHLMSSLPFIYRNILTLKSHRTIRPQSDLTGTKQPVRQMRRCEAVWRNTGTSACPSERCAI